MRLVRQPKHNFYSAVFVRQGKADTIRTVDQPSPGVPHCRLAFDFAGGPGIKTVNEKVDADLESEPFQNWNCVRDGSGSGSGCGSKFR